MTQNFFDKAEISKTDEDEKLGKIMAVRMGKRELEIFQKGDALAPRRGFFFRLSSQIAFVCWKGRANSHSLSFIPFLVLLCVIYHFCSPPLNFCIHMTFTLIMEVEKWRTYGFHQSTLYLGNDSLVISSRKGRNFMEGN